MDLTKLFVGLSVATWRYLDQAALAGFSPREETLTENLLINFSSMAPQQVRVRKTTSDEEAHTGTDFALALEIEPSRWMYLLVQAKKLSELTGLYAELRKQDASFQADHLLAESVLVGALPIYLFYNGSALARQGSRMRLGGCQRAELTREPEGPPWVARDKSPAGCTLVHAARVEALLRARPRPARPALINAQASPWECLLCPFRSGKGGIPDALSELGVEVSPAWLRSAPPGWVASLLADLVPEMSLEDIDRESIEPAVSYLVAVRNGSWVR